MPFTSQDEYFSLNRLREESLDQWKARIKKQQFVIHDEIIQGALMWSTRLDNGEHMHGVWYSKQSTGYALLTFLVRQALGLYRFPYCEDRILSSPLVDSSKVSIKTLLPDLTPTRVKKMIEETYNLYLHTQKNLTEAGLKTVTLGRRLYSSPGSRTPINNYGHTIIAAWQSAKTLGLETIDINMDSLNQFGDDGAYAHYPISLHMSIPASDILCCSNLVKSMESPGSGFSDRGGEPGEWLVINRSPTGAITVPIEAVRFDANKLQPWDYYKNPDHARKFLNEYTPIHISSIQPPVIPYRYAGMGYKMTGWGRICSAWSTLKGDF
ncbi:hypothetical protein ACOTDQ_06665 [Achromobacter xylosoxidans]|uniref:hypothetical protein n=1 Tax=Alcaligenes xylosoxydans xylosoxydans TaxID=85698 RepID=UPI001EEA314E|nr:hypothetical protein [Achromobacter xylosoxidans]